MCRPRRPLVLALPLFGLWLGACAIGNVHRYDDAAPSLRPAGTLALAIATHDERPYVLSHEKAPAYVGTQRGGFGNPFDVRTASGRPLADDVTDALASALKTKGYRVTVVRAMAAEPVDAVASKLASTGADRGVLLTLRHWKSDTYTNTSLDYDVTLRISDASGALLAEKSISGRDNLGGSVLNPPAHAKEAIPQAFRRKMEDLFASPDVDKALR